MAKGKLRVSGDFALPLDWAALATVVYGARGSGKTSLTLRHAAIVSGYSVGSSTSSNACSRLRSLGLIVGSNTVGMTATPEAGDAVGEWTPLPTGAELAVYWYTQLSPCESAILRFAIENTPSAVTLKQAAEAGGYSTDSSTPSNAAGKLRTLGLIEGANSGFTANERLV